MSLSPSPFQDGNNVVSHVKSLIYTLVLGCFRLLEEGGTIFTFEGSKKKCPLKSVLRIHSPKFYWKVCTFNSLSVELNFCVLLEVKLD
jgi:hypothetical protein